MTKLLDAILSSSRAYLTDNELAILLNGTADSRYGKVKRLLASGKLLHVRRGLYCMPDRSDRFKRIHPFEIAQHVYGPSYISLESALSYHRLIPEAVITITSVSSKRTKEFHTPLGVFSYQHLPTEYFYTAVEIVNNDDHQFMMATPWKAICDYIYCYKKDWYDLTPLAENLRIEPDSLPSLRDKEAALLDDYYHQQRITRFLKGII